MKFSWEPLERHPRRSVIIISTIFLLAGLLSNREFWVEDEARYAHILTELMEGGHWLVLYLNGEFYPDKPPLFYWLASIPAYLYGQISVRSFMWVTYLSGIATVLASYELSRLWFSVRISILSSMVLMSTLLFIVCAGIVRMDMLMTLFIILAARSFWLGAIWPRPSWVQLILGVGGFRGVFQGPLRCDIAAGASHGAADSHPEVA